MKVCNPDTTPIATLLRERVIVDERTGVVHKNAYAPIPQQGSEQAREIQQAHDLYKRSIGTVDEGAAYARLEAVVLAAKGQR